MRTKGDLGYGRSNAKPYVLTSNEKMLCMEMGMYQTRKEIENVSWDF